MAVEIAQGIHNHPQFKLGSILGSGLKDKRTVNFGDLVNRDTQAPKAWDFDAKRKPFIPHMWGNDRFGDCEIAGRCNYITRLQRGETKKNSPLVDDDAVALYKQMTGCVSPGDNNDTGLTTLGNLRQWRAGWLPESLKDQPNHKYQIAAFGYVDPTDHELLALCTYLFSGVILGVNLPITVQSQMQNNQPWDYDPSAGAAAEPGSWGGHCVYTKRYDEKNHYFLTWQQEVQVTQAFMNNYAVEGYAVIESFETWGSHTRVFDVQKLIKQMKDAGIHVET